MKHSVHYFLIVITIVLLVAGSSVTALAQGGESVNITNPEEGQSVSGILTLTGTVDFPNFMKYEVFLKTDDEMLWAATVYAPVISGNLAQFDTRVYPDGAYQLVIRTVRTDSNYEEYLGPTFFIENELGAPQPFPEIETGFLYPPVAGALVRIKNCSGNNMEFDYTSPEGFCSSDNLWIMAKAEDSPVCPYQDALLIPCEYRGTAVGEGEKRGATYMFNAEAGKIYEFIYAGDAKFFINEIEGAERTPTDTGALDPDDPARSQPAPQREATVEPKTSAATPSAAMIVATAAPVPAEAEASTETETMLPISGRGTDSNTSFIFVSAGLILLLVVGGVIAARSRMYDT